MNQKDQRLFPDLFAGIKAPGEKKHIFTVSEITQEIKSLLEAGLQEIWVEGEISNCRPSAAGHLYFSLKDQNSLLSAVIFSRTAKEVPFKLVDGQKVICFGNIEVYGPRGQYQIIIEKIEPQGVGSLQLALEQLKQKLEKEGLFAPAHKRRIPYLPSNIGVVTSLQGAAIKDILKVLDRRFKDVHVVISPVRVQGDGAKEDIARAIEGFNRFNQQAGPSEKIEVLIVGRGGGSIEDLWAFNEEVVARAIYNSAIPVISAVGHERDVTIADLVADVRAATPSVAAELAIPPREELRERLRGLTQDLQRALVDALELSFEALERLMHGLHLSVDHTLELSMSTFEAVYKKLNVLNPAVSIIHSQEKIADLEKNIVLTFAHFLRLRESEFKRNVEKLSSLSPLGILGRGYSITFTEEGEVVKDIAAIRTGDTIKTRLHKGTVVSQVKDLDGGNAHG